MDNYVYAASVVAVIRCYPSHTTAVTDLQDVLYCTDVLAHSVMPVVIYACVYCVVLVVLYPLVHYGFLSHILLSGKRFIICTTY